MNKPESSLDEWRKEAERLALNLAHVYSFVGDDTMPTALGELRKHLDAHPSNQVLPMAIPEGYALVPCIGTVVKSKHPITCLNPTEFFEVTQVRAESDGKFAVRGEQTCWFGLGYLAASPQAVPPEQPQTANSNLPSASGGDDLPPALPRWEPIETAPKDGTTIALAAWDDYDNRWRFTPSYWREYLPGYGAGFGWAGNVPTHWMPLPLPPGESAGAVPSDKKDLPSSAASAGQEDGRDAKRLDYLQRTGSTIDLPSAGQGSFRFRVGGLHAAVHHDLRAAIDAAMSATTKEN